MIKKISRWIKGIWLAILGKKIYYTWGEDCSGETGIGWD